MLDLDYFKRCQELIELRYNPYHDPGNGRFTSGGGGGGGSIGTIYVPNKKKGEASIPEGYIQKPEGMSSRDWKQLKSMRRHGEMPEYIMGNYDEQAVALKAINQLYPEVAPKDLEHVKVDKYEQGRSRYIRTKGLNTLSRSTIPKGYENDPEVINGALKMFVANLKKQRRI